MCRARIACAGAVVAFLSILAVLAPPGTSAQSGKDLVAVYVKVNPVMKPKTGGDVILECAQNDLCRTAVDAAAAWLGVPPGTVTGAMALVPKVRRAGEEGWYMIALPEGYEYCRTRIKTISVTPNTGDEPHTCQRQQ
jgi:hypothetical protein